MTKAIITMSVVLGLVLGGLFPVSTFIDITPEAVACGGNSDDKGYPEDTSGGENT